MQAVQRQTDALRSDSTAGLAGQPLGPWLARDLAADPSWIQRLSAAALADIEAALAHAQRLGKPLLAMTPADFPVGPAGLDAVRQAMAATQRGWGLCLLKGFPVERWTEAETRLAYWGLGLHLGVASPQNAQSDVLCDIRNAGNQNYHAKGGRGYNTNFSLDFHVDFCDVVSLLCRRASRSGGTSLITSSLAVVDEIARTRPDLLAVLRQPFCYSLQGAQAPGRPAWYRCPIVGEADGHPVFRTNRKNITAAQRDFPEVPRLTDAQVEALDLLDQLLPDPRFCYSMQLEPGDWQLVNNYVVIYSRTEFQDFDEPDRKRHLLRLWLTIPDGQPLPADWAEAFGDVRGGAVRGGNRGQRISAMHLDYERRQAAYHGMHNHHADERPMIEQTAGA